jgi:hypothetical protein
MPLTMWLSFLALKSGTDFLLLRPALTELDQNRLLRYWIPFEVYFTAYVVFMPVVAFLRPGLKWKGRAF